MSCVSQVKIFFRHVAYEMRRRWEDNIKMDPQEVGWGDMEWLDLAQERDRWRALVNAVIKLRVT